MIKGVTIGSDIEVFLRDRKTKEFISSVGLVPGSKNSPYWIDKEGGYAIETDNVAVEFLIPPCKTEKDFIKHIGYMLTYISKTIPGHLEIAIEPAAKFSDEQLDSDQAKEFGCDADYNPYKLDYNPKPDCNTNYRSIGAHVHLGYENPNVADNIKLVKAMDLHLGVPSLLIDDDTQRRKIYGKGGSCRFKKYGVEYRVLSPHFISSKALISWVWKNTMAAIEFVNTFPDWKYKENLESIINTNNKSQAEKIIKKYNINMPKIRELV